MRNNPPYYKIKGDFIMGMCRSKGVMKKIFALLGAILSVIYLVSPVDLISEIPLGPVGLIDDAAVIPILLACLKVLGVDFTGSMVRWCEALLRARRDDIRWKKSSSYF